MRTRKRLKEPPETPQPTTADNSAHSIDEVKDDTGEFQQRRGEPPIWANVRIHPLSLLHSSHILNDRGAIANGHRPANRSLMLLSGTAVCKAEPLTKN
jgi:hypothetical protein